MAILLAIPSQAFAADPAVERDPVAFYQTDNSLSVFFNLNTNVATPIKVKTGMFAKEAYSTSKVSDGDTPVTYVILMDGTWSMGNHRREIGQVISAIYSPDIDTEMALLPYNQNGVVERDSVVSYSAAELKNKIEHMAFGGYETSPASVTRSVLESLAIDYVARAGGLVNVVVISDKMDTFSKIEEDFRAVQNLLASMPQLLFHTIQVGSCKGELTDFGRGCCLQIGEDLSPEAAGAAINSFVGGLERVTIPWAGVVEGALDLYLQPTEKNADGSSQFPSSIRLSLVPYVSPLADDVQFTEEIPEIVFQYNVSPNIGIRPVTVSFLSVNSDKAELISELFPRGEQNQTVAEAEGTMPSASPATTLPSVSFNTPIPTFESETRHEAESADGQGAESAGAEQERESETNSEASAPRVEPEIRVVSAYRTKDEIAMFMELSQNGETYTPGSFMLNGYPLNLDKLSEVRENEKVSDIILLDRSASMANFYPDAKAFVELLALNSQLETRFVLAGFQDSVLMTSLVDTGSSFSRSEVQKQLSAALNADFEFAKNGQSGKSILEMIDYIQQVFPAKPGSLVNLILLTNRAETLYVEEIQEILHQCPEILFHSVYFGQEEALPFEEVGLQLVVNGNATAAEAAEKLRTYINSLHRVLIPYQHDSEERQNVQLAISLSDGTEVFSKTLIVENLPVFLSGSNGAYLGGESSSVRRMSAAQGLLASEMQPDTAQEPAMEATAEPAMETSEPEETEVTVTKVWDDADNKDGKRPESVTVNLLADDAAYGGSRKMQKERENDSATGSDTYRT